MRTGSPAWAAAWPTAAAVLLLLAAAIQTTSGAGLAKRSLSALARTSQLPHSSSDQSGHDQGHGGHGAPHSEHQKRSELQEEAIREELLRQRAAPATEALLAAVMDADQYDNILEDKRSLAALARDGNLPMQSDDKRSLSALARDGNLPMQLSDKRSVSSLARDGNLPMQLDDKRSLSSLARYGNLPAVPSDKRSLEALARGGLLNKNAPANFGKRSLSSLAKAGELPKRWRPPQPGPERADDLIEHLRRELEETKRGISSLARSGGLSRGADSFPYQFEEPVAQVKRNMQSLARTWSQPEATPKRSPPYAAFDLDDEHWAKRNAAALLRQTKYQVPSESEEQHRDPTEAEQQGRRKRSLWDDDLEVTTSGEDPDWDGLPNWSPTAWGAYFGLGEDGAQQPAQQKRFLGRIPNMGRHRQKTNEDSSPRRRRPH